MIAYLYTSMLHVRRVEGERERGTESGEMLLDRIYVHGIRRVDNEGEGEAATFDGKAKGDKGVPNRGLDSEAIAYAIRYIDRSLRP